MTDGHLAEFDYYPADHGAAGRLKSTTNPAGKIQQVAYNLRGQQTAAWGQTDYPLAYEYSDYGEMITLHTFQASGISPTEKDLDTQIGKGQSQATKWHYDEPTGLLLRKEYADGHGTDYRYTESGQLKARLWSRGTGIPAGGSPKANAPAPAPDPRLTTTYTYDETTGALTEIHYPAFGQPTGNRDPQTGNRTITYTHDRQGRVKSVTDPTGSRTFDYDARGQLIAEHHTLKTALGGEIRTILHRAWTDLGQPASVTLSTDPDSIIPAFQHSTTYEWDSLNRLSSVKSLAGTFTYQYDTQNPALLTRMTGPVHRVDTTYEPQRNLIAEVANVAWASLPMGTGRDAAIDRQITKPPHTDPNTAAISRYTYENDPLGRRAEIGMTGAAFDRFGAPTTVEVAYNDRSEVIGATYRSTGHPEPKTGNGISRYTYRYDAIGNREKATVETPEAKTETTYAANSLNQYTQVEEKVLRASAALRETSPAHDPDGNLLADARFTYTWDAENRLIGATAQDGTHRIEYAYDHQSRRVLRREYNGAEGGALTGETAYLYDDWNLVAEIPLNPNSQTPIPAKLLTWGRDLSGSLQGAGGVGGLLAITEAPTRAEPETEAGDPHSSLLDSHYFLYDANGNVTQLLDPAGDLAAHYEYDPFGNVTRMEGEQAAVNPWRFSTKPEDGATGMLYYGFRYLDTRMGKWVSRDPIGERGGTNLYGFVGNDGMNLLDFLGLAWSSEKGVEALNLAIKGKFDKDSIPDDHPCCNQFRSIKECSSGVCIDFVVSAITCGYRLSEGKDSNSANRIEAVYSSGSKYANGSNLSLVLQELGWSTILYARDTVQVVYQLSRQPDKPKIIAKDMAWFINRAAKTGAYSHQDNEISPNLNGSIRLNFAGSVTNFMPWDGRTVDAVHEVSYKTLLSEKFVFVNSIKAWHTALLSSGTILEGDYQTAAAGTTPSVVAFADWIKNPHQPNSEVTARQVGWMMMPPDAKGFPAYKSDLKAISTQGWPKTLSQTP